MRRMSTDESILGAVPEFFGIDLMLKARPSTEGGERFIYVEASREDRDQQGEIVLAKALQESADHFTRFGVIDLDHKSMPSVARQYGIENPEEWAIGQPVEVRFDSGTTFVKAQLYSGDTPMATRANMVWDRLTKLTPAARYYASVGGSVLAKAIKIDPKTGEKIPVVTKTRWNNLALTTSPVCQHLESTATTMPVGVFAKSLGGFVLNKALESSYATDAAAKTGGAALATQSLDTGAKSPKSYFDFRDRLAAAVRSGKVSDTSANGLMHYSAETFVLSLDESAEWVDRFLSDLKSGLSKKRRIA